MHDGRGMPEWHRGEEDRPQLPLVISDDEEMLDPADISLFLRIRDGIDSYTSHQRGGRLHVPESERRLCWEGSLGPCYVSPENLLTVDATSLTPETFDWPEFWSALRGMTPQEFMAQDDPDVAPVTRFHVTLMLERGSDGKVTKLAHGLTVEHNGGNKYALTGGDSDGFTNTGGWVLDRTGERHNLDTWDNVLLKFNFIMTLIHDAVAPQIKGFALVFTDSRRGDQLDVSETLSVLSRLKWE